MGVQYQYPSVRMSMSLLLQWFHQPSATASPRKCATRFPSNTVKMYQSKTARMFQERSAVMFLKSTAIRSTKMSAPPTTSRSLSTTPKSSARLYRIRLKRRFPERCVTLCQRRTVRKCLSPTLSTRMRQSVTLSLNNSAPKFLENLVTIIKTNLPSLKLENFYEFYFKNILVIDSYL